MDEGKTLTIADGRLDDTAARDHLADPRSQYETVTAITRRHVDGELVYNLVTASGAYRVGAGYLVHNCGVPVIVTDWTSMPELCGAGWKVVGDRWWDSFHTSFFMCPSVYEIVDALEQAYEARGDTALREQAREFAAGYDADRVMLDYWIPALAKLEAPREVGPLPNRAMKRRAAKKKVAA